MAHLWLEDSDDRTWRVAALSSTAHALLSGRAVEPAAAPAGDPLVHAVAGLWVLIGGDAVCVNGERLLGGVRVLRHGDEVRLGARRIYYAEDDPPRVVAFPGADAALRCPRCTRPIAVGTPAVRSRCGMWLHQSEASPCFTYGPCPQCPESTDLDAGFAWSPEAL